MAIFINASTCILISCFMLHAQPPGDRPLEGHAIDQLMTINLSQVKTIQITRQGIIGDLGAPLIVNHGTGSSGWTATTGDSAATVGDSPVDVPPPGQTLENRGPLWAGLLENEDRDISLTEFDADAETSIGTGRVGAVAF
ncbi:hypothetical protein C8Q76DRAFT_795328 [Earliella scabrosa]|nr:hypothetical protein C8Q76DRAFT_795328 [Earliella scabrosa]